jgi:hypothetical protein
MRRTAQRRRIGAGRRHLAAGAARLLQRNRGTWRRVLRVCCSAILRAVTFRYW